MPTPNPQAVEALAVLLNDAINPGEEWDALIEEVNPCVDVIRAKAEHYLRAAEPHIRSQVLTELAEELLSEKSIQRGWDRWNECNDKGVGIQPFLLKRAIEPMIEAACRQLAAKEESDD